MNISDFSFAAGCILGILIISVLAGTLKAPLKWIFSLVLNGVCGCVALYAINMFLSPEIHISINPITTVFMGILGIPGVVALVILSFIL